MVWPAEPRRAMPRLMHSALVVGNNAMAGCCKELRQQGGKRVHKKTHYAKVDGASAAMRQWPIKIMSFASPESFPGL